MQKRHLTGLQLAYGNMNTGNQADGNTELWSTRIGEMGWSRKRKEASMETRNGNATDMTAPQREGNAVDGPVKPFRNDDHRNSEGRIRARDDKEFDQ
jgi:hypothetical protein